MPMSEWAIDPELEAEMLVVGGGPAGAACALTLANLRRRVVLCEAARFPREHVGVCLSPGVIHQLGFLGIWHILDDPANRQVSSRHRSPR
ncbi:NAD(P)-binding protein [Bradyrhizobium sp. 49]|nr:NAD(P)-binding protein [Bradyrhizobium sp. 84]MCK1291965.1 NAD(P)-binding protein [Bradyrhizobium sp. 30]MCK1370352.1 NAD(P)-binding protein [Bradyrhizobium sp. 49]